MKRIKWEKPKVITGVDIKVVAKILRKKYMVNKMSHKTIASLGGDAVLQKYGPGYFSSLGKKSAKNRFSKMTEEEKKEYFKRLSTASIMARKAKKELQNAGKTA